MATSPQQYHLLLFKELPDRAQLALIVLQYENLMVFLDIRSAECGPISLFLSLNIQKSKHVKFDCGLSRSFWGQSNYPGYLLHLWRHLDWDVPFFYTLRSVLSPVVRIIFSPNARHWLTHSLNQVYIFYEVSIIIGSKCSISHLSNNYFY